jgi:ATP adenylyltransferase
MHPNDSSLHQTLWAPWRLSYITAANDQTKETKGEECFLCRYARAPQGRLCLTVLNRFPYNNGHLLVAPLAHKACLSELSDEESLECQRALARMVTILSRVIAAEGFNVGLNLGRVAGAGVPGHLHWHLVPRWNGDTNFMPVLADVNVIPQALAALFELVTSDQASQSPTSDRT